MFLADVSQMETWLRSGDRIGYAASSQDMISNMLRVLARPLSDLFRRAERRVVWTRDRLAAPKGSFVHFTCNLCGKQVSFLRSKLSREGPSCFHCGSTVRFRSIIHVLSTELFGKSIPLTQFPERKDLTGIGMSDWRGYANQLERKLSYINTYYHKEPRLDITQADQAAAEKYDFIISTEVFEHVPPPVDRAFANAFDMLKPGGVFIFSVPFRPGVTDEHFPELHQFEVTQQDGRWVLLNTTFDGQQQRFIDLVFHGGPGTTLEMREFGRDSLQQHLGRAGFKQIEVYEEEVPEYGILCAHPQGGEQAFCLESPPWAARK